MRSRTVIFCRRLAGVMLSVFLPAVFVLVNTPSLRADEEEKLIPLVEAGEIHNSALLSGAVNRFENAGIPISYPVYVVKSKDVNAYADGRKVVFYSGLLDFVEAEGEVAYVVGHEMSHNIHGHPRKQTYGIIGLVVANAVLSSDYQYQPGRARDFEQAQLAQDVTLYLLASSYGRTQEYDADRYGLYLMVDAGYDPNEAIAFQERLLEKSPEQPGLFADLLSTHPTSQHRIQQMRNIIGNELYQDDKGDWHHRNEPLYPKTSRNTSSKRLKRGTQLAVISGGASFLFATLEQSQLKSDGVVSSDQRQHNVWVAVRNGVVLGFLTGAVLIVDVPGSGPPALSSGKIHSPSEPITFRYNLESDRWEIAKSFRF